MTNEELCAIMQKQQNQIEELNMRVDFLHEQSTYLKQQVTKHEKNIKTLIYLAS